MVEFNPDGSIKLPEHLIKNQENYDEDFRSKPCVRVVREQISERTPLKCELRIQASPLLRFPQRITSIFDTASQKFKHGAQLSIRREGEREYVVRIISGRYRCSWCENFRKYLKNELGVKVQEWGSCFDYLKGKN